MSEEMNEGLPLSEEERRLTELVREAIGDRGPFRPVAFYQLEPLDRIDVILEDRSVTEMGKPYENFMVIMTANHPNPGEQQDKPVGFAIDCAGRLAKRYGLVVDGKVNIYRTLREVLRLHPEAATHVATARQLLIEAQRSGVSSVIELT